MYVYVYVYVYVWMWVYVRYALLCFAMLRYALSDLFRFLLPTTVGDRWAQKGHLSPATLWDDEWGACPTNNDRWLPEEPEANHGHAWPR